VTPVARLPEASRLTLMTWALVRTSKFLRFNSTGRMVVCGDALEYM
jgi:hypothetical protein